jgi:hypothetical protein
VIVHGVYLVRFVEHGCIVSLFYPCQPLSWTLIVTVCNSLFAVALIDAWTQVDSGGGSGGDSGVRYRHLHHPSLASLDSLAHHRY